MSNGWETYSFFLFAALLSWVLPMLLYFVSWIGRRKEDLPSAEKRPVVGDRIHPRYFSSAHASAILVVFVLAIVPCASSLILSDGAIRGSAWWMLLLVGIMSTLGLLYLVKKGDVHWTSSSHRLNRELDTSDE